MSQIVAKFKGVNNSGYIQGESYTLEMAQNESENIIIQRTYGKGGVINYTTFDNFLDDWEVLLDEEKQKAYQEERENTLYINKVMDSFSRDMINFVVNEVNKSQPSNEQFRFSITEIIDDGRPMLNFGFFKGNRPLNTSFFSAYYNTKHSPTKEEVISTGMHRTVMNMFGLGLKNVK
jgi:hypothetical protein